MKSGDAYKFTLSWPMDTEERILAGEFLRKLGNKKSRLIVELICDYIKAHPEAVDQKETIKVILNSPSVGETLNDMIRSIIQSEFAGKFISRQQDETVQEKIPAQADESISDMLENLDIWKMS